MRVKEVAFIGLGSWNPWRFSHSTTAAMGVPIPTPAVGSPLRSKNQTPSSSLRTSQFCTRGCEAYSGGIATEAGFVQKMWIKVRCYKPSMATPSACLIGTNWWLTEIRCLSNCLQPNFLLPNSAASAFLCLQELNPSLGAGFCRSQLGRLSFSAGSWSSPKALGVVHWQGSIPKASTG